MSADDGTRYHPDLYDADKVDDRFRGVSAALAKEDPVLVKFLTRHGRQRQRLRGVAGFPLAAAWWTIGAVDRMFTAIGRAFSLPDF